MVIWETQKFNKLATQLKQVADSNERKVRERYRELAGLEVNGEMVNLDKAQRARQYVTDLQKAAKAKRPTFYRTWWWRILEGLFVAIVGGVVVIYLTQ